jgi:hypothetical protein
LFFTSALFFIPYYCTSPVQYIIFYPPGIFPFLFNKRVCKRQSKTPDPEHSFNVSYLTFGAKNRNEYVGGN